VLSHALDSLRGRENDESRVVCGALYPSDVEAGQVIATAVVERLHSVPEFSRDLACAKQEYRAIVQSNAEISTECKALGKGLTSNESHTR